MVVYGAPLPATFRAGAHLLPCVHRICTFFSHHSHGDMIYAQFTSAPDRASAEPSAPLLADPVLGAGIQIKKKVNEDAVDVALRKKDGWIKREYDQTTCFGHPKNGSCVHCMPLPVRVLLWLWLWLWLVHVSEEHERSALVCVHPPFAHLHCHCTVLVPRSPLYASMFFSIV